MTVVLLIDDEPQMGELVHMCLDGAGVRVVQATCLSAALETARREPPSVVLLDLSLGAEDGLDILPELRAEPLLAGVPIIAFTVHDSRRAEALDRGVAGFVSKPFKAAGLRRAIVEHLR